jgi:hypothetical protein
MRANQVKFGAMLCIGMAATALAQSKTAQACDPPEGPPHASFLSTPYADGSKLQRTVDVQPFFFVTMIDDGAGLTLRQTSKSCAATQACTGADIKLAVLGESMFGKFVQPTQALQVGKAYQLAKSAPLLTFVVDKTSKAQREAAASITKAAATWTGLGAATTALEGVRNSCSIKGGNVARAKIANYTTALDNNWLYFYDAKPDAAAPRAHLIYVSAIHGDSVVLETSIPMTVDGPVWRSSKAAGAQRWIAMGDRSGKIGAAFEINMPKP